MCKLILKGRSNGGFNDYLDMGGAMAGAQCWHTIVIV